MSEPQLDLFSDAGVEAALLPQQLPSTGRLLVTADSVENLDDEALIAAIPDSSFSETSLLAAEAGRRRLVAAIPALAALCRRFVGFGTNRTIPEQSAALQALALIGGREAAHAVAEMIERAM